MIDGFRCTTEYRQSLYLDKRHCSDQLRQLMFTGFNQQTLVDIKFTICHPFHGCDQNQYQSSLRHKLTICQNPWDYQRISNQWEPWNKKTTQCQKIMLSNQILTKYNWGSINDSVYCLFGDPYLCNHHYCNLKCNHNLRSWSQEKYANLKKGKIQFFSNTIKCTTCRHGSSQTLQIRQTAITEWAYQKQVKEI